MRIVSFRSSLLVILVLAAAATPGSAQVAKIRISGSGIETVELTAADLTKMPRLAVDAREPHTGEMQHYKGVRLSDLLLKAGAPMGEKLRGQELGTYVVARASDGYAVMYSLAELDPAMTDNQIMEADTMNGKALAPKEGPFRVLGHRRQATRALGQDG
jgi:hypothetical protein